ncbi:MAG: hypothetical protein GX649_13900, partial [Chloroflexi bacterium]|nr:hypothetical protein [Chloroflexota bacterium]
LGDELAQIGKDMARAEGLLGNPSFVAKAPAQVVQKERDKLAAFAERRTKIEERLAALG